MQSPPKEEITTYNISILGLSKAWLLLFCDGPIKDAHHKKKKKEKKKDFWGSTTNKYETQICCYTFI